MTIAERDSHKATGAAVNVVAKNAQ